MPITLPHTDADYWANPARDQAQLVMQALGGAPGLSLGGPAEVEVDARSTLPLVGYLKCSMADKVGARLERTGVLVAAHLDSGQVFAGPAWETRDRPRREGPPPKGGMSASYFTLDARRRLPDLPWREGTLVLRLLSQEMLSPPVTVRLTTRAARDPAVREFLDQQRRPGYPQPVWPAPGEPGPDGAPGLPRWDGDAETPPPPAEGGIALSAPRVAVLDPARPCVLRGSFRLPLPARARVSPRPPEAELEASGWRDVGDPRATAVIPLTLLLVRDSPAPIVLPLQVPVHAPLPADAREAQGQFALDLLRLPDEVELSASTYCVYAFSGAACAGPIQVALVSPDQLPRPGE